MAIIKSIIILLSVASYYDYEIWKMDVNTAFIDGYLEENIYMVQPNGFITELRKHGMQVAQVHIRT